MLLVLLPTVVQAVSWLPLVPCGVSNDNPDTPQDETQPCNQCDLFRLLKNIIDFVLMGLMPPLAMILFVWGGFLILMGGANPSLISQGKTIFWNTVMGVAIISSSWLITNTIIRSIAADNIAPEWWKFECRVGTAVSPTPTPIVTPTPTGSVTPTPTGNCTGVVCSDSNLNVCGQNTSANCSDSAVNAWDTQIKAAANTNQIGSGIDTVALVKAIISQESGGRTNINASDGLSYGILQMRPETANNNKSGCTSANITPAWLNDSNNVQASVCIAINYLKSLIGSCGTDIGDLAAGYNGGGAGKGACNLSTSCASCSMCGSDKTRRWECLWDGPDGEHKVCNVDRDGNFNYTRRYVPKVSYCYGKFGGTTTNPPIGNLTLASIEPAIFMAGTEKSFNQQTGISEFTYLEAPFEIKGTGLTGATLQSNNTGVDGKPGIEFKDLQVTDTRVKGIIITHSTAKDGKTTITIKNSAGKTATKDITVNITGTQYLARKFANSTNVKFFGRWPGIMPDSKANQSASLLEQALLQINKDSYKKLNIVAQIYEPSYWDSIAESRYCGSATQGAFKAAGCASPADQIIYIQGENNGIVPTILHESAHKLHFYYLGKYTPVHSQSNDFQNKWQAIADPIVSQCSYIPITFIDGNSAWSNGKVDEQTIPRCSFIWAYGAYEVVKNSSNDYYEDVATMTERNIAGWIKPNSGDAVTNSAPYQAKYNLLNQYGF